MLRIPTDWNNIQSGGNLLTFVFDYEELPPIGTAVLAVDGSEMVTALVIEHVTAVGGTLITLEPNWGTQEEANAY